MSWMEYQLAERFVQRNPWYWGMVLEKEEEGEEEKDLTPEAKKERDEAYSKILIEEARAG